MRACDDFHYSVAVLIQFVYANKHYNSVDAFDSTSLLTPRVRYFELTYGVDFRILLLSEYQASVQ